MSATDLIVNKSDLGSVQLVESPLIGVSPGPGQVKLTVNRFGLSSNNLSYAGAGDTLGYWNFFPTAQPGWGIVPAWGFATVSESANDEIAVGEQIFGYLPMGRHLMLEPHDIEAAFFGDRFEHRADLHPWYNRYYRVDADPASTASFQHLQPLLWALHMTGWMLAREFVANDSFGAEHVLVASASSKTAVAFARSTAELGQSDASAPRIIGLTSPTNAGFVESLDCYDEVATYDDLGLASIEGKTALVHMAGNAALVSSVHEAFGDRLVQSIIVGGTHFGARGSTEGLPGPTRRFFFIPDVAEKRSAEIGHASYHAEFAAAWAGYAAWADPFLTVATSTGPDAIRDAYLGLLSGAHDPTSGTMLAY